MIVVRDARFQVSQEQTHVFLFLPLQFSHCQIDIVLLINGDYTLINVVIADPIQVDLVSWVAFSRGVASIITT
jgi:hypothetical protein